MSRKLKPPTKREKYLMENIKQLQLDNDFFTERVKVLEKRFDFIQDETAKLAIEQQALIKGVSVIVEVAHRLMDEKKVPQPQQEPSDKMAGIN